MAGPEEAQRAIDVAIRTLENPVRILLAGDVAESISQCTGLRGFCYHEAGHGVVGCLAGRLLTSIEFRLLGERRLVAKTYFAEADARSREAPPCSDGEGITGLMRALDSLYPGAKSGSRLDELRAEVESMLRQHWGAASAVARVLEERLYMIRPQFCDIVREVDPALLEGLPHSTMQFAAAADGAEEVA